MLCFSRLRIVPQFCKQVYSAYVNPASLLSSSVVLSNKYYSCEERICHATHSPKFFQIFFLRNDMETLSDSWYLNLESFLCDFNRQGGTHLCNIHTPSTFFLLPEADSYRTPLYGSWLKQNKRRCCISHSLSKVLSKSSFEEIIWKHFLIPDIWRYVTYSLNHSYVISTGEEVPSFVTYAFHFFPFSWSSPYGSWFKQNMRCCISDFVIGIHVYTFAILCLHVHLRF